MKQLLLFLCILSTAAVSAQDNWSSYRHTIPVSAYHGKKFRVQAFVRVDGVEEDAAANLAVKLDKATGPQGYVESAATRDKQWKSVIVDGVVSDMTDSLSIGLILKYNGVFYFDDIQVDIELKKNKWTSIYKEGFEGGVIPFSQSGRGVNKLYTATVGNSVFKAGKSALAITGKGVPNWGVNSAVGKSADVNGVKLYYEVYGAGTPLVVVHGNGGAISNAGPFYPKLIQKYKVIAIDSRGHGKSSDTDAPFNYEQMASDVNALLDQLKIDSAFVWGQSDGAILAFILALDHPKKVKRAVAYGGNVQPDSSAVHFWAVNFLDRTLATSKDVREKKLSQLMKDHPHIDYAKLKKIQAPILVMSGDRDVIRLEHTVKIFQSIPNSNLCILPVAPMAAHGRDKSCFSN